MLRVLVTFDPSRYLYYLVVIGSLVTSVSFLCYYRSCTVSACNLGASQRRIKLFGAPRQ